jgi:hypothetical protein
MYLHIYYTRVHTAVHCLVERMNIPPASAVSATVPVFWICVFLLMGAVGFV